jgi:hypothetical protein
MCGQETWQTNMDPASDSLAAHLTRLPYRHNLHIFSCSQPPTALQLTCQTLGAVPCTSKYVHGTTQALHCTIFQGHIPPPTHTHTHTHTHTLHMLQCRHSLPALLKLPPRHALCAHSSAGTPRLRSLHARPALHFAHVPVQALPDCAPYMPAPPCTLRMFQCRHSLTALNQPLLGSASPATEGTGHLLSLITTASPGPNSVRSLPSNEAHTWPRASAGTCRETHSHMNTSQNFTHSYASGAPCHPQNWRLQVYV